ncbi:hypothetical protein XH98_32800 [Bradyrhizobium sp. CCBAU 51745]|nr:hypothetical protein [Bradyrhizobium sp. CCBAU 51745]
MSCSEREEWREFPARERDRISQGQSDRHTLLACRAFEETHMKIVIQKLNGLWHLIVGSCRIRTPFLETQDRALVVTYARRAYPGAKIFQRD